MHPWIIQLLKVLTWAMGRHTKEHNVMKWMTNFYHFGKSKLGDHELALFGPNTVVPSALWRNVLSQLNDIYQGTYLAKRQARQPGINSDKHCQGMWTMSSCVHGFVDRLSGWSVIVHYGNNTTSSVIRFFRKILRDYNVLVRLRMDGGPQLPSCEFQDFLRRLQVLYPHPTTIRATAMHEAAVRSVKHLILKVTTNGYTDIKAFARGLLEIRNIPCVDGRTPVQIL